MAVFTLPLKGETYPHHSIRMVLDGRRYELVFRWNQRASSWFCTILNEGGEVLLGSRRILPGQAIIGRFGYNEALPLGELLPIDTTNEGAPPDLAELGQRVQVVYVDAGGVDE